MTKTTVSTLFALVLVIFAGLVPAGAQQAASGYLGKGKEQYTLFIFGDAFAGGLWAGLNRIAKNHPRLKINGRYREGSGLARPNIYDWKTRLPRTLENREIDIALVFIGANDAQDMRVNGQYLVFNSPEWKAAYTANVETMMTQLKEKNIAVYWLEQAPVAQEVLDFRLQTISKIHRQLAAKHGIRFVELRASFTTSDGKFTKTGADIYGNIARLRTHNGIRFIKAGNNKLASIVLQQINTDIQIADGERSVADFPPPAGAKTAVANADTYTGPIFASPDLEGGSKIFTPRDVAITANTPVATSNVQTPTFATSTGNNLTTGNFSGQQTLKRLGQSAARGSTAKQLFSNGTWTTPPPGRVDDFSATGG